MKWKVILLTTLILISCNSDNLVYAGIGGSTVSNNINTANTVSPNEGAGTTPISTFSAGSNGEIASKCLGDYPVVMPGNNMLDASDVVDKEIFSPIKTGDWFILDHVGVTDSAYAGARHIVKRDTGIQWFGYDKPPFNDMMLKKFENCKNINIKQAPVRADWHTVNGSGVVFGASLSFPGIDELTSKDLEDKDITSSSFSGYAFVATMEAIEIREYNLVSLSSFKNGSADFKVLYTEPKQCNSQSLTVDFSNSQPKFSIGLRQLQTNFNYTPKGIYAGAMVDYAEHNCSSLSSIYMFNFTVDGKNYFA